MFHAEVIAAEGEPILDDFHHGDRRSGHGRELKHTEADRTGADHEHEVVGLDFGALDRMRADAEGFNEGELFVV